MRVCVSARAHSQRCEGSIKSPHDYFWPRFVVGNCFCSSNHFSVDAVAIAFFALLCTTVHRVNGVWSILRCVRSLPLCRTFHIFLSFDAFLNLRKLYFSQPSRKR